MTSTADLLKSYARHIAEAMRFRSPGFKREADRHRAPEMASQSFPNNNGGYVRREKTEQKIELKTPRQLWRDVYRAFVDPVNLTRAQSPGRLRRRRHSKKRFGIRSSQRAAVVAPNNCCKLINLLGHSCRVAREHLNLNNLIAFERSLLPSDLSVNAVETRRIALANS